MDSNSLPMAPDLEVFSPVVRYIVMGVLLLAVSFFGLAILIGILS